MKYSYRPKGICASKIDLDVENGIIKEVLIHDGCDGNHKGLSALLRGMDMDEAISRLSGITCNFRPTSCPDQVAVALKKIKEEANA